MVETRRTSRRLQAQAQAQALTSPSVSPSRPRRSSRTPSPSPSPSPAKQQQQEQEQEVVVIDDDTESEQEAEMKQKQKQKQVEVVEIEDEETEDQQKEQQKEVEEVKEVEEGEEQKEEEVLLLEDEEEEAEEEEDDEEEDVDRYAFLAASGLNLSTRSSTAAAVPTARAASQSSTAAELKQRLVPNELDSGASQYQNFFNFDTSKSTNAATLRPDARAAEEAGIVVSGQKSMAHSARQRAESQRKKSAGRRWFNFESEEMTADARRDFALLKMRNYLDPKKFYKSSDHSNRLPKHFQMGVVIEGASEFHSARLTKKQRRQTFTDEIMADEAIVQYTHRVASNIQKARSSQGHKKKRRTY